MLAIKARKALLSYAFISKHGASGQAIEQSPSDGDITHPAL